MAGTVGMVEATAITGMAMVFLGMVIITAIAIISSLITAAGNGAPTARSMSATPAIDLRRRKEARPGREARVSFFDAMMDRGERLPRGRQPISLQAHRPAGRSARGVCTNTVT
jgi:hypothetical protein